MSEASDGSSTLIEGADAPEVTLCMPGWHVELIQLGRGQLRANRVFSPVAGLDLIDLSFGRAAVLRGVSPSGHIVIVFAHPSSVPFRVVARPLEHGDCLMLGSMALIDLYMPETSRGGMLSISCGVSNPIDNAPALGASEFRSLRLEHRSLLSRVLDDMQLGEQLAREAAQMITQSVLLPADPDDKVIRRLAVQRASRYIDAHLMEQITLADLCHAAGARSRTLEYGFLQCYDVGPMSFLRSLRLSRVRRDLSQAPSGDSSVTASARRWHFSHMGQFSRDYRLLFGESPSTTLARAREHAGRSNARA